MCIRDRLKELYECVAHGKEIKTTAMDAVEDLKLFRMMMEKYPDHKKGGASEGQASTGFLPSGP